MVPDNYHDHLVTHGFVLQQEFDEVLVDKYFDNHEHQLLKEDHWLRQRNGDWELKYPGSHSQTMLIRYRKFLIPSLQGSCSNVESN